MRVALLYVHALDEGGYPRDVRALSSALARSGVEVSLICEPGVQDGDLDRRVALERPAAVRRLAGAVDLVHVFGILLPAGMLTARRLLRSGTPVVVSPLGQLMPHGYAVRRWKKAPYLALIAPWLEDAWFHTFGPAEDASLDLHFAGRPRFTASLGVYPCPAEAGAAARAAAQAQRPESGGGRRAAAFLYLGRNDVHQKGIDLLLESVSVATRDGADCSLTIAGAPWADSPARIERLLERPGLRERVRIMGTVDEGRKWSLLAESDYLVFLSRWDGPPRPIREALSVGLPVVVSPETNLGHLVESHGAGLQVPLRSEAVAGALLRLCRSPELRPAFVRGALALRSRLQWDRVALDYVAGYRRVLEGR